MFDLEAEDYGNEIMSDCLIMDPDGQTIGLPPESFKLPERDPGEINGWFRILPFLGVGFSQPGIHEIQLRVDGEVVAHVSMNLKSH